MCDVHVFVYLQRLNAPASRKRNGLSARVGLKRTSRITRALRNERNPTSRRRNISRRTPMTSTASSSDPEGDLAMCSEASGAILYLYNYTVVHNQDRLFACMVKRFWNGLHDVRRGNRRNRKRRWSDRDETYADPQPDAAKRWISQARYDLRAVESDQATSNYEWACFKCHQVQKGRY